MKNSLMSLPDKILLRKMTIVESVVDAIKFEIAKSNQVTVFY